MGRLILSLIGFGAIAYLGLAIALWLVQTRLMFFPQPPPVTTPATVGRPYEDVVIPVGKGHIHGWWLPAADPRAKTALIFHGNASNVESSFQKNQPLLAAGLAALIIDYRGYGLSSGPFPNEARVYEDATAAWEYLTQGRQIPPGSIVIWGDSIGGAIAIELARHQPHAAGLVVQASFTSMGDMMDYAGYGQWLPKWLLNQRFDSLPKVATLRLPTLFIHGEGDRTVPATMSQRLYAATPEPKTLWLVPGAAHNDIATVAGAAYEQKLTAWLATLPPTP